jgi:hypothetical protein
MSGKADAQLICEKVGIIIQGALGRTLIDLSFTRRQVCRVQLKREIKMTRKLQKLTKISEIILAFGDLATISEWAGVCRSCVCNWETRGYIPASWHWLLSEELAKRGFEVDPALFGYQMSKGPGASSNPRINRRDAA